MPGHLALGAADSLGDSLNLAQVGGIEGEDSIRLPQLGLLDDDGFGLIVARSGHVLLNLFWPKLIAEGSYGKRSELKLLR